MTPKVPQGTTSIMFSRLGCVFVSRTMFSASTRPRSVPTTIEVSAMNEDSITKTACTIPRRKPIARSTPICWRRSTTARALITPRAATPTIRPSPMKPWIRRLIVRFADIMSLSTFSIDSACIPFGRNADSSFVAVSSGSTPAPSAK
jgi:hypothetical protein